MERGVQPRDQPLASSLRTVRAAAKPAERRSGQGPRRPGRL